MTVDQKALEKFRLKFRERLKEPKLHLMPEIDHNAAADEYYMAKLKIAVEEMDLYKQLYGNSIEYDDDKFGNKGRGSNIISFTIRNPYYIPKVKEYLYTLMDEEFLLINQAFNNTGQGALEKANLDKFIKDDN